MEGRDGSAATDHLPVAGHDEVEPVLAFRSLRVEVDEPHRLLLAAAVGACDPGDGDTDVDAEPLARTAIAESVAPSDAENEASARAQLARVLAESGKVAEARKAIDDALRAATRATTHDKRLSGDLDIDAARLAIARTAAERSVVADGASRVAEDARRGQWLGLELCARLLHARAGGSREELAAVAAGARAIGQVSLAGEADEASAPVAAR